MGPKIKQVQNNKSKGKTYTKLLTKYNEAMENGYYGEAELIVYAFLEDRLRALIYHYGALDARNSREINEKMSSVYGRPVRIDNISAKIDVIKCILDVSQNDSCNDEFTAEIKTIVKYSAPPTEIKRTLSEIKKWCDYRNEITHAMFNKDIEDLRSGYEEHVKEGYLLARQIDKYVAGVKRV